MKTVVQEGNKMLVQELEESVSMYWLIVSRSLRILLVSLELIPGVLSVVLVSSLVTGCCADRSTKRQRFLCTGIAIGRSTIR